MRKVNCPYCKKDAELVNGERIYPHRPDLFAKMFWLCEPCNAYVGTHSNSDNNKPLGRLANADLRRAKTAAHAAFDPLWKEGYMSRTKAYAWLARRLHIHIQKCHIGMFDLDTCYRVIRHAKQRLKDRE